jgi:hypothetical protein
MALSDAPTRKNEASTRRRSVNATTNKQWSDSQKVEAVTTYLSLGNLALTARVLKIPEFTLRDWKQKVWWKEVEDELKVQEELQLSERLKRIIESTLAATEDRIQNGDFIYDNRTGSLVRKPVNLRDVHKVTMDMVDKRDKILNKNVTAVPIEAIDSRLEKLAQKFAELAKPKIEVTDVIFEENQNSLHEERPPRLQDGVREVPQPTGADQESHGTDPSQTGGNS